MNNFVEIPATKKSLSSRKLVFGIGINDAEYMVCPRINGKKVMCPYYKVWQSMLMRGYCKKYQEKHPTYIGCSVNKDWLIFSVFKLWMKTQEWKGMQLDKDIIRLDNKEYGPETCAFVSAAINNLLTNHAARRGKYPQGVSWYERDEKYQSQCRVGGKKKHLGYFSTINEAEIAYLKLKSVLVECAAKKQIESISLGLLRHAEVMKNRIKLISKVDCI